MIKTMQQASTTWRGSGVAEVPMGGLKDLLT
jgi:hypothetical protein